MVKVFYSVWVGDGELTDNYIENYQKAVELARLWRDKYGYEDTLIEFLVQGPTEIEHLCWDSEF